MWRAVDQVERNTGALSGSEEMVSMLIIVHLLTPDACEGKPHFL